MSSRTPTRVASRFTGDHALGLTGVGLALASAAFGIGMTMHGPAASFGTAKDFTVFAQLAPRRIDGRERAVMPGRGKTVTEDLDLTETASIPKTSAANDPARTTIIPAVTLEAVGADSATVAYDGVTRVVRVGDEVPGAGQIMAIVPGARPALKTSRGLIVPAAE